MNRVKPVIERIVADAIARDQMDGEVEIYDPSAFVLCILDALQELEWIDAPWLIEQLTEEWLGDEE